MGKLSRWLAFPAQNRGITISDAPADIGWIIIAVALAVGKDGRIWLQQNLGAHQVAGE